MAWAYRKNDHDGPDAYQPENAGAKAEVQDGACGSFLIVFSLGCRNAIAAQAPNDTYRRAVNKTHF